MNTPRYEKVDANTIKIVIEKAQDVPLYQIIENKKKLLEQKAQIESTLESIEKILAEAKKLKITPKVPKLPKKK